MKKIIALSIVAFVLSSCKKDRVCECTNQDGSLYSKTTFTNISKKEAKSLCTTTSTGVTCTVK